MREFYIIQRYPDGWHHHDTEAAAILEALRLARKEGGKFRVFRAVGQAKGENGKALGYYSCKSEPLWRFVWWAVTAWRGK